MKTLPVFIFCLFCVVKAFGQCPTANFGIEDEYCTNETVYIDNLSTNGTDYSWDFCANDDLNEIPTANQVTSNAFGSCFNLGIEESSGNFYAFVPAKSIDKIVKLDFGSDPSLTPGYQQLTVSGDVLDDPTGIDLIN
ncbi:MAG: hypothetical protein RLO81_08860, partial [Fulvivirga sp.]|uniref:hypothetical protein n=1 Tax=Fulvivirga sp. TaxID=1931237 RepID=UPI0032F011F5